ncbi:DUF4190 domain-containing protein [Salinibacterium sp. PAMC 21357]|uniref:DUF4190 domain-containing protein n=1 Tax=Salinibacterium sp. PAMC 21357 TaxID=1112215 RepID=UPI00028811C8|nr:DUF4190 domain-containing protein [Salinibacterium sp. PAMC 21357]
MSAPAAPAEYRDPYAAASGTPVAGYASGATPGQAPFTPVPAGPAQGLSIGAMVTGISSVLLSFMLLGFLPGVAAVILGHIAQKKQPYARPFWLTGLITGYISVAIGLLSIIAVIVGVALFWAGVSQLDNSNFRY